MDSKNAIEVRDVVKTFRYQMEVPSPGVGIMKRSSTRMEENRVIDGISFDIKKGEVVGIIGRNGSGKSTLLSMIARIMEPDSGTISVSGKVASIMELGMGFHPDMSGRENIYLKGELYGFSKKEMDERIDMIIDYSGIGRYIDNPVRTYSSGMTGRLAFAIMVNVDSEIMLIDEILSVGDVAFKYKAREHFRKMVISGKTIIMVSHSVSTINDMCSRAIWIEGGQVKVDGKPKIVCAEYEKSVNEDPKVIMDLANEGVPESEYELAQLYKDGIHFKEDLSKYEEWLHKSADHGFSIAQVEYGDYLINHNNGSACESAIRYYSEAANHGNNDAKSRISSLEGKNIIGGLLIDSYEKMMPLDNMVMQYRYADLLQKVCWDENSRIRALELLTLSSNQGYPEAKYQLALLYRDGVGIKRDLKKMESLMIEAADLGNMPAILFLSDSYMNGKRLKRDEYEAFKWYLKGARMGNGSCQYQVAMMYREGIGVSQSLPDSNYWYSCYNYSKLVQHINWILEYPMLNDREDIIDNASEYVKGNVQLLITSIKEGLLKKDEKKIELALRSLENLSEEGSVVAMRQLSSLYSQPTSLYDPEKSFSLRQQAASRGDVLSYAALGRFYRDGYGIDISLENAINNLMDAGLFGDARSLIEINDIVMDHDKRDLITSMIKVMAGRGHLDSIIWYVANMLNGIVDDNVLSWYKSSASLGDRKAITMLADWYKKGINVERDLERSHYYYDLL